MSLDVALDTIARKMGRGEIGLRVGFLEGATYPDGTSVATVAAVQNFGAPAKGIPPRPFFSDMVKDKSPRWSEQFAKALKAADYDVERALSLMGEGIAGQLREAIQQLTDPPLAAATVARKGFAKPLVDTGHMLASVGYEVKGP